MPERGPVVAAVVFYRQTPERLERCVRSLAGRCAGIAALDGPFAGLSNVVCSPEDNYEAIADTADAVGLTWSVYEGQIWSGEPQKRTAAARAALKLSTWQDWENPWVLVLDSDEFLESDIDWDVVLELGRGTGQMVSYRWPERAENEGGDGSRMVRLVPNTPHLLWGPAHFDLRDMSVPITYSGWEKALANDDPVAFKVGHDLGTKVIQAEYDSYNDRARIQAEGRMMRVVDDYSRGGRLIVRMDCEQAEANGWKPGMVVSFNAGLLGTDDNGFAEVTHLERLSDIAAYDIHFRRLEDGEAEPRIQATAEAELARRAAMTEKLQRRVAKRRRSWEKGRR